MSQTMEKKERKSQGREMGGAPGAAAIMLWSHFQLYYMWFSLSHHKGRLWTLSSDNLAHFVQAFSEEALPTLSITLTYLAFFVSQLLLAQVMPGMEMKGLPVASLNGRRLRYLCNGYTCFYTTLFIFAVLHFTGMWPVTTLAREFGRYLTVAVLIGDLTSLLWYFYGVVAEGGSTGSPIHDFFMGTTLNPRIGVVDIKMVAEARWSWTTLLMITVSHAALERENRGHISYEMLFMIVAHWLYANACAKGEHFIVPTIDMATEKFGWMLNFWNIAGVPFAYCFSSVYLAKNPDVAVSSPWTLLYAVLLLGVYYVWDVANYQKNDLRLVRLGETKARERNLFPVLPWSRLENPKVLETPKGVLLIDGFYAYARKIHYTMDILMSFLWGAVTHFTAFLPFFYTCFFTPFIFHRYLRDDRRCAAKYGEHWEKYKRAVPYVFVPGIF
eukprot:Sspe_Gene.54717::Locus_30167_Transcript_1_1_Confidence_1.000_Length_1542::g.54717::m.54717/K00223/ERG4; Delta24(24(1))-sterol reductase